MKSQPCRPATRHELLTMSPPPLLHSQDPSATRRAPEPTRIRYFGDYEVVRELARGGMGVVFLARQVSLNRTVALKMILAGQLANDTDVKRFYTEAEAAANLDHPGIVPIFEVGEHEGQHYFSMGFIEGQSLSQRLSEGPLPAREAAELIRRVSEAIDYAHQRGVIHRDLKPANILLDKNGNPRVTDFGLAKKLKEDSGLTGSGQIMGTPSYMPPEQAGAERGTVGPAVDVYALGATLYALITGRPPFQAASVMDTVIQVLSEDPVPPRRLDPSVHARPGNDLPQVPGERPGPPVRFRRRARRRPAPIPGRRAGAGAAGGPCRPGLALVPAQSRGGKPGCIAGGWRCSSGSSALPGAGSRPGASVTRPSRTSGWPSAPSTTISLALARAGCCACRASSRCVASSWRMPCDITAISSKLRAQDPTVRDELMRAYQRVGDINNLIGTATAAEGAYRQSLSLAESLAATRPDDPAIQRDLARLQNHIGLIQMKTGQTDLAFSLHEKSSIDQRRPDARQSRE